MLECIKNNKKYLSFICLLVLFSATKAQKIKFINVADGWAHNTVNTVVFRKNSLVTFKRWQYIAYYDEQQNVIVGKRKIHSTKWDLHQTKFKGDAKDAHRSISVMVDGDGYLHLAWDHHNSTLNYARSVSPGSMVFSDKFPMTGKFESRVTYPEFYRLADGGLLFLYRNGESGEGNLVMNKYNLKTKKWIQLHNNLIDGEGKRNAYWQMCIDAKGTIHISWVWRETADVATNHDLCYAKSKDGGITWEKSNGEKYTLPITQETAEYACRIPEHSELINQTSMTADESGTPYIATYWKDKNGTAPQYRLVYLHNGHWNVQNTGFRHLDFSLSGMGTKSIPISRPQVFSWKKNRKTVVGIIFRDAERGSFVSLAMNKNLMTGGWTVKDIYSKNMHSWEPTFDTELWKNKKMLDIFLENTLQVDAEGESKEPPQMIKVLTCKF